MRRGVTMVELLVVVAVIATLASLLLPGLRGARESARMQVCASNLRQLATANEVYAGENRDRYAPGAAGLASNRLRWHGSRAGATGAFSPEGGSLSEVLGGGGAGVRECPTFRPVLDQLAARGAGFERSCGGYGYNLAYVGVMRGRGGSVVSDRTGNVRSAFADPAGTLGFADSAISAGGPTEGGLVEYSFIEPRFWPEDFSQRPDPSVHFRHARLAASAAWLDTHVSVVARTFTWASGVYPSPTVDPRTGWPGDHDDNRLFDLD